MISQYSRYKLCMDADRSEQPKAEPQVSHKCGEPTLGYNSRYLVLLPRPAAGSRTFWLKLSSSEGTQYHSESTVRPLGSSIL